MMGGVLAKPHFRTHSLLALGVVQSVAVALSKMESEVMARDCTARLVSSHAVQAALTSLSVLHTEVRKCACQTSGSSTC